MIDRLYRRVLAALAHLGFAPPLLARLVLGLVFVPSGWGKLHDLPSFVEFFRTLGIPAPELQAPFVATVELVCWSRRTARSSSRVGSPALRSAWRGRSTARSAAAEGSGTVATTRGHSPRRGRYEMPWCTYF